MEKYRKKAGLFVFLPVIIWVLTVGFAGNPVKAEEKTHTIWFFFENVCASCHEEDDFYDLFNRCVTAEEKASISYDIRTYNVFKSADEEVYEKTLKENGKEKGDVTLPVLYIDGQWLSGYDKIEQELHGVLFEEENSAGASEMNTEKNLTAGENPEGQSEYTEETGETAEASSEITLPVLGAEGKDPAVLLFTTYSCNDCEEIKEYLKELQESENFALTEVNVAEGENIRLFKELLGVFGCSQDDGKVPAVFAGETALLGKDEIREKLPELLKKGEAPCEKLEAKLNRLGDGETVTVASLATLFGAGLLAGFNPCSISMLLMLFSILITTKASVLKNGILYLVGKYLTYLGLGLGICFAASRIDEAFLGRFGQILNGILILLFLFVAVMNFLDFLNVRKAEYGRVRMQLPKKLRHFNHQMLKKASHMEGAFLGILILGLGIAVSLGEFFCTGQIYMASILYLLRNAREQWLPLLGTLMVYVTAMSIPAVVILAVIAKTKGTGRVSDFMLKHMGAIKLLNCLLFLFYAVYFLLK